jgi:peptide/nickel transport system permease protein
VRSFLSVRNIVKELSIEVKDYRRTFDLLLKDPLSIVGMVIITGFILVAVFAPIIAPYPQDWIAIHQLERGLPPSSLHPFGTDDLGRDVLSRVILGARISVQLVLIVVFSSAILGVVIGGISGTIGGAVDEVLMRVTDMFLAFPPIILAMAIGAALGPSIVNAMIAMVVVWWPWYTRLVRGQALAVKERNYVEAAKALGLSRKRIIFRHILPNCLTPVIIQASLDAGWVLLTAAGLSFIGLGAQEPMPEWGLMISVGRTYLTQWWWISVFPGLAIFVTVLGFNLIGDVLRDVLEPRTK